MIAFQHVALNCRNPVATEEFYTRHFGFHRARVFNRDQPDQFVMLRLGGMCLELFKTSGDANDDTGGEQRVGFKHLAFEVPKLEPVIAGLQEDGVTTERIIDCSQSVPGLRICFFKDPDGNILELMEGWKDEQC